VYVVVTVGATDTCPLASGDMFVPPGAIEPDVLFAEVQASAALPPRTMVAGVGVSVHDGSGRTVTDAVGAVAMYPAEFVTR
jgi:hypothetical protein